MNQRQRTLWMNKLHHSLWCAISYFVKVQSKRNSAEHQSLFMSSLTSWSNAFLLYQRSENLSHINKEIMKGSKKSMIIFTLKLKKTMRHSYFLWRSQIGQTPHFYNSTKTLSIHAKFNFSHYVTLLIWQQLGP